MTIVAQRKELGEFVDRAVSLLATRGWHSMVQAMRGESDIQPDVGQLPHSAAPLLDRLRRFGCPCILSTPPPTPQELDGMFERGPHSSALDHTDFLTGEFLDYCRKNMWMVLPYSKVRTIPGLRLSPMGVVPQTNRRPRSIVDYSYWGINDATARLAPAHSMQFGRAHHRLTRKGLHANPKFGPVHAWKVDLSDGFYRVAVTSSAALRLGVLLPPIPGLGSLVAFPLTLPMGWTESPPYFCAFTETTCDLINDDLRRNIRYPLHPLEHLAGIRDGSLPDDWNGTPLVQRPVTASHQPHLASRPLAYSDIYMDDFLGMGQDHPSNPLVNQRRTMMHRIDSVFRPNRPDDNPYRKEPISTKKLQAADASIQRVKRCMGWDHAPTERLLLMAPTRKAKALDLLDDALHRKRIALKSWQSLVGVLRSLVPGTPGSKGQFSLLQLGLQHALAAKADSRVRITAAIRAQLHTFRALLADDSPALYEELLAGTPLCVGACDAAKSGMGGVWFLPDGRALLWRQPFPSQVQDRVVSWDNPRGTITNSDLELAGTIAHLEVLTSHCPSLAGETVQTFSDNTPAVYWQQKGSTTTGKAAAYLLQTSAFHQRQHRYNVRHDHLPGDWNRMADDASRLFNLSDSELTQHFVSAYPQSAGWTLCHLTAAVNSQLISDLLPKPSTAASPRNGPAGPQLPGSSGFPSVPTWVGTPASPISVTRWSRSSSLDSESKTAALPPVGNRSWLAQQRTPCVMSARRFPQWALPIPA